MLFLFGTSVLSTASSSVIEKIAAYSTDRCHFIIPLDGSSSNCVRSEGTASVCTYY